MVTPRWLGWAGRKVRAVWWIYWQLLLAAMGQGVAPFLDRKGSSAARKRTWRVLLSITLLVHLPLMLLASWLASWPLRYVPYVLLAVFLYGSLREIWRS